MSEAQKNHVEKSIEAILKVFSGPSDVFVKKIMHDSSHLEKAKETYEEARQIGYSNPNLLILKVCIFECLMGPLRDFKNAKLFLEDIEEDLKAGLELPPYYLALFKINKGFFEVAYNLNTEEAIRFMDESLSLLKGVNGYKNEQLRASTNLSQYYSLRGQSDIAEKYIDQGKPLWEQSLPGVYSSFFLFIWAMLLNDQGKFEEAENILSKSDDYPDLSVDYPTLELALLYERAEISIKQGHLERAWKILEECEAKTNAFFQKRQNTTLANVYVFKSSIMIHRNEPLSNILFFLTEALEMYGIAFQGNNKHRNQARAHLIIGKAYAAHGEYDLALKEYIFSEEIYNTVLKEKKIDDVSELYKALAILGAEMKDKALMDKYLKIHKDTFGGGLRKI